MAQGEQKTIVATCQVLDHNSSTSEAIMSVEDAGVAPRRRPSPKLKGTRIIGNIMSPVVPEGEWDVLK
jgi:hypothetical protein